METENRLDKFGKFLVKNLRDTGISKAEGLLKGEWRAPSLLNLQTELGKLSDAPVLRSLSKKIKAVNCSVSLQLLYC